MFADDAVGKVERYFPPKLEWLQAWALAFRCHLTFGNYLGYVKTACLIVGTDVSVFGHPAIGRAKMSIRKASQFTPRPKMWIRREKVAAMMEWAREHAQYENFAMLFLLAYWFLSRLPSEALPAVAGRGTALDAQSVLWKTDTELILDLRVRKNTNTRCRITRTCMCSEAAVTCPLHVLGPLVDACPEGQSLFPGMNRTSVLRALRVLLDKVGVEKSSFYGTHDLRRGHALDLQLAGAPLQVILEAGGWRSPAFLKYLDLHQLDRDLVVQSHIDESSSDEEV